MLDLVKGQLEHTWTFRSGTVDLTGAERAEEGVRKRCREKKEYERHFCHAACSSRVLESVDIGLSRAAFVPSTLFLSSMKHHQVLCVLSACCPCLVCMLSKVYLARVPFETRNP